MRVFILAIIALLPLYVVRFSIGSFPTTLLEMLLLVLFAWWFTAKVLSLRGTLTPDRDQGDAAISPQRSPRSLRSLAMTTGDYVPQPLHAPIALFLIASIIAVAIAPDTVAALGLWRAYIVEPLLFFVVFVDTARSWHTVWRDVSIALALSVIGVSFVALWQWFDPAGPLGVFPIPNPTWVPVDVRRATSVFGFPNAIGLYVAPIVMLLIGAFVMSLRGESAANDVAIYPPKLACITTPLPSLKRRGARSLLYCALLIVAITAGILSILAARSDGALIALAAGIIMFGLLHRPLRRWTIGIIATFVLLFAVFVAPPLSSFGWARSDCRSPKGEGALFGCQERVGGEVSETAQTLTQKLTLEEPSGRVRVEQWYGTIAMLRDRPILGAGLAGYPIIFAPYNRQPHIEVFQYPHNILLNFWSELGLAGVLTFGWILVVFFRATLFGKTSCVGEDSELVEGDGKHPMLRRKAILHTTRSALLATMLVILIHGLVDVPYFKNDLAIFFWLLVALLFTHTRHQKNA